MSSTRTRRLSFVLLTLVASRAFAQEPVLTGRVSDETGGVLSGAVIEATGGANIKKTATTDKNGTFKLPLPAGTYVVTVTKARFNPYANGAVEVAAGRDNVLEVQLGVSFSEEVRVEEAPVGVSLDGNTGPGALVLKEKDLETLPDDPDELAEALQALAGPAAGPNGGQFFIDGFSGGRLPPKSSIREIRFNQNPFSAEYDQIGFSRVQIFTKPGTDRYRGDVSLRFNDESLNARNPFAPTRPPSQVRDFRASLSGPLVSKKASFSISAERSDTDNSSTINASVLDDDLNVVSFSDSFVNGSVRTEVSPRVEYALGANNTLVARYSYSSFEMLDSGVGDFSLPSRAFDRLSDEHSLQLTETAIIRGKVINEVRFQFRRETSESDGDISVPGLDVMDAFNAGGSQNRSTETNDSWELGNTTSWTLKNHSFRAGFRVRGGGVEDLSWSNFGGRVTFGGGIAPVLDAGNQVVRDAQGDIVFDTITSIERYRRTLLFAGMGLSAAEIRVRGGGATQLSITGGSPEASVDQSDVGVFIQDDWRVKPNLTASLGLRYENQTNISSPLNIAPRFGFAWAPGQKEGQQPKLVLRGGAGIFYDRFSQGLTLSAHRSDGTIQQQYVVTSPQVLDRILFDAAGITFVPSADTLTDFQLPRATRVVSPELEAPYRMQGSLSIERQLPAGFGASLGFVFTRTQRELRSRNINAPTALGERPQGHAGAVYQYESTGKASQEQVFLGVNRQRGGVTLFGGYSMTWARSDTDGAGTFPADQYDLSNEWGRASFAARHNVRLGGSVTLPWGRVRIGSFIRYSSGRPFNITTGRDNNGDTMFTDRPAFATDPNKPGVVQTAWGLLDPNPEPGQKVIPRNYGTGPSMFLVNLNLGRTFGFGGKPGTPAVPDGEGGGRGPGGGMGPGGGGGGGRGPGGGGGGGGRRGGFGGGGGDAAGRYNLTVSVQVSNLFNHVNRRQPVGNLSSPLFGQSTGMFGGFGFFGGGGGARRIELNMRLGF
jgi:hypothetical protein